jgi:hypothetical protein
MLAVTHRSSLGAAIWVSTPLGACALLGCERNGASPPDEESEYVDLYLDDGVSVCAGQMAAYDRFVEQIFEVWTGSPPGDFRVAVHARAEGCSADIGSCATPGNAWLGSNSARYHEVVHVMHLDTDGRSALSLEEGTAEALGPTFPFATEPSTLVKLSPTFLASDSRRTLSYTTAAEFARFSIDSYGNNDFRAYFRAMGTSEDRSEQAFGEEHAAIFGESLNDAWADFTSERRCAYDFWYCDADVQPAELPYSLDGLDCASENTQGFEGVYTAENQFLPAGLLRFDFQSDARLTLTFAHVKVQTGRCGDCTEQRSGLLLVHDPAQEPTSEFSFDVEAGANVFIVEALPTGQPQFDLRVAE